MNPRIIRLVLACLLFSMTGLLQAASVGTLRCESRDNPLGVDVLQPRLSWQIQSGRRGETQTAYRVLAASSESLLAQSKGDLWDSGRVDSDQSVMVPYSGVPLQSSQRVFWKVRIWDRDGEASEFSRPASWTMGLLAPGDWQADWIQAPEPDPNVAVWMRKSFDLQETPERALVSVNIAGYAELYINGKKAGSDVLTPAISAVSKRTFYVTCDVTKLLRQGRNVIGLWLGRGWAPGSPMVRARLEILAGNQKRVIGTDASWKTKGSCYRHIGAWKWNDFGGEQVDARNAIENWCMPKADDAGWTDAVKAINPPSGSVEAQPAPLNRIGRKIPAVSVTPLDGSGYEIDFGTTLTGWLRMEMPKLEAGKMVKLSFADARPSEAKRGTGYQTFNQVSEFVSGEGEDEVFENKFNYAGFRYVIVEGLPQAPAKTSATALLVESDLEPAGSFECSNDLLNRIHRLNEWTQRCLDLGGYYVDCPHRERMGYGGDGQVAVEGFMTGFRADNFYRKWLADWRLSQRPDGSMPIVSPVGSAGGGPIWPGLVGAVAWRHYLYYGDRSVLEENYDTVRRYLDWVEGRCNEKVLRKWGGEWPLLGDWVPPGRGMDSKNLPGPEATELFNNCYRVYQWELLEKMAAALDRREEVARCREHLAGIRPAIHAAFFDPANNRYVIDEQAYYLMPLMAGVTPESVRAAVFKNLESNILEKNAGHLDTGMLGTYFLMEYLRDIGRNDLVFTMFNQTSHPSWGYMLAQGATTCWEQWNGYWSHIHACFASANNWLYQGPGGIRPDATAPGFKRVLIEPAMVGDLAWVRCSHDSPHGKIVSNWKREAGKLTMEVVVPPNTTARILLPVHDLSSITEGGAPLKSGPGISDIRQERGGIRVEAGSGRFTFTMPQAHP